MQRFLWGIVTLLLFGRVCLAGDWPAFRGPAGNGFSDEQNVPVEWGKDKNVKWQAKLPGPGNSSPIVVGDKVIVTCAQDQGKRRGLHCFDRNTGKELWNAIVEFGKVMPTHQTNPYCASTPASDGERVVAWHGSAGLHCYDLNGKELWRQDLGEFKHIWGYGASPIIYKDRVIQNCAPGAKAFVAAFDKLSGKELWRLDEPTDGDGDKRADGAYMGNWSTPVVATLDGRDQIVCMQPTRVVAYETHNGEIIWQTAGLRSGKGDLAYSSPMLGDGVCVALGGFSGASLAFRPGGQGDITESARLWLKPTSPQSIGTGVIIDGFAYVPDAGPGTIRCLDAKTGALRWADRTSGNSWGSIVVAEGRAYLTNQAGVTLVFRPTPEKFDLIAKNDLGEPSNSTPAISNGQIFIRTMENLWCIEAAK